MLTIVNHQPSVYQRLNPLPPGDLPTENSPPFSPLQWEPHRSPSHCRAHSVPWQVKPHSRPGDEEHIGKSSSVMAKVWEIIILNGKTVESHRSEWENSGKSQFLTGRLGVFMGKPRKITIVYGNTKGILACLMGKRRNITIL